MTKREEYAAVVESIHDAALAIDASADLKIAALINVAIEAAFAVHGPEEGRRMLLGIIKQQVADAFEAGAGEDGYYKPFS
jgi:hypothetical protein